VSKSDAFVVFVKGNNIVTYYQDARNLSLMRGASKWRICLKMQPFAHIERFSDAQARPCVVRAPGAIAIRKMAKYKTFLAVAAGALSCIGAGRPLSQAGG
jgi:hypothetical protein